MVAIRGEAPEVMAQMLADRELLGARLLLGLTVAQLHTQSDSGQVRWKDAAFGAVGPARHIAGFSGVFEGVRHEIPGGHLGWLQRVIAKDLPRYEPPAHRLEGTGSGCQAPTARKARCDRPIGTGPRFYEPDPDTGECVPRQFCHKHRAEGRALWDEIKARPAPPAPAANRGGVLARYLDTDWPRLYRWADSKWTMPPSGPPLPKPRLTVLVTDETDYAPVPEQRAVLSLVADRGPSATGLTSPR